MNRLTNEEKAYIAGIIDGEGSIMLIRHKVGTYPSPSLSVASTTYELLSYLKSTIGAGNIRSKNNYKPSVHLNSYTFELRGDKVLKLLSDIHPFLQIKTKQQRSKLLLDDYNSVTIRNGRYTNEQLDAKKQFYNDFITIN